MGSRNIDRIPIGARRRNAESVGAMLAGGWEVEAWCGVCGIKLRVELAGIVAAKGASYSLWDRRARCRRVGCQGRVRFHGRPPGAPGFSPLVSRKPDPDGLEASPDWLARNRGEPFL